MKTRRILAASIALLIVTAHGAAAQNWQRNWERDRQPPQSRQQVPQPGPGGGGGACVPSGFAQLSRNCSVNTGGCQRMPETCNRGWCCP